MKNHTLPGYQSNAELQGLYREVFAAGPDRFFTFMSTEAPSEARPPLTEENETILSMVNERPPATALEIGCGEGRLAFEMAQTGSHVVAIDYAETALASARHHFSHPELRYENLGADEVEGRFDTVVLAGTLEHLDAPFEFLDTVIDDLLAEGGRVITSSPSFLNPRGIIWMTLVLLADAPLSLSDRHFLFPWEFEEFSSARGLSLRWTSCDQDWACGQRLLEDFTKRIPNVVRDAALPGDPERFLEWLRMAIPSLPEADDRSGATAIYELTRVR